MRRRLLAGPVLWLTLLVVLFLAHNAPAGTQDSPKTEAQLPITRVVLFSSGVGFFQRDGEVTGNAKVDLAFPVANINDLIKSMVLRDLDGGRVSVVSFDSSDPVEKTLKSFAIDLTNNPTFGGILKQARGEKIEVTLAATSTQPGTFTGTIVSVEVQRHQINDQAVDMELLNLLTADGIRSLPMRDVQKLRFLNANLDRELKQALETLAKSHDTRKKSVTLNFLGNGKRKVSVGYVVEHPIWKTSYRLVLDQEGKPFLQGWAMVENPTDEDWKDVRMTLVSGRPISFVMDLYQPLYVNRPKVEPELFASLRPPTYSGSMDARDKALQEHSAIQEQLARGERKAGLTGDRGQGGSGRGGGQGQGIGGGFGDRRTSIGRADDVLAEQLRLDQGVQSAATATEIGDFFQYALDQPVNLQRQKSAMLPIINQPVEGTKVSIYNPSVHAKYPLMGLKFKNTTGLHLMQGPITVFEGNSYAGDARILDLQPKEERLLSYAIDLGTEVEAVPDQRQPELVKVKIFKGLLHATHKLRAVQTYNIKNRGTHDRSVIVEHPFLSDWTLVEPKTAPERSRDVYRFEVKAAAGQSAKLNVVQERTVREEVRLMYADDQVVLLHLRGNVASPKVKEALAKMTELRAKMAEQERQRRQVEERMQAIRDDQTRLQGNLKVVPPSSNAYKKYVEKFDTQETELEQLQEQQKKLKESEDKQRKALEDYLMSLDVE
jgi:hypothetical protein